MYSLKGQLLNGKTSEFVISLLLIIIGLSAFSINTLRFREYTMDDAYITYRYAINFANGEGLVFNPNEDPKSEGVTSPLWALILSLSHLCGADIKLTSKLIGLASTLLTAGLIWIAVFYVIKLLISYSPEKYSDLKSHAIFLSSIAVLVYLIDPYLAGNTISGMETSLSALCYSIFLFSILVRFAIEKITIVNCIFPCVFALASCLLRPELTLGVIVVLALCLLFYETKRDSILIIMVSFLVLGSVYFILRYLYYEMFLPLPYYVKHVNMGLFSSALHVLQFLRIWLYVLPFIIVFVIWLKRNIRFYPLLILTIAAMIHIIYLTLPAHMMGFGFRYFQPIVPAIVVITVTGIALSYRALERFVQNRYSTLLVLALMTPFIVLSLIRVRKAEYLYLDQNWEREIKIINIGRTLHTIDSTHEFSVGLGDCGAIPFYSKWNAIDFVGLNDRYIARSIYPEGIFGELEKRRPQLIIWGPVDDYIVRKPEDGYERTEALGYKYVGKIHIDINYNYRFYGPDNDVTARIREALAKSCNLYETE